MSQRDDLLAAARKLLVEKGYERTTARDLAAESGAHLGSISYHFGSKDALMTTAALAAQGEWGTLVDESVNASDAETPSKRLAICVDTLMAAVSQQPEILTATAQTLAKAAFDDEIRQHLAASNTGARRDLAALALGLSTDDVSDDTATQIGTLVHALLVGLSMQMLIDSDSMPTGKGLTQAIEAIDR